MFARWRLNIQASLPCSKMGKGGGVKEQKMKEQAGWDCVLGQIPQKQTVACSCVSDLLRKIFWEKLMNRVREAVERRYSQARECCFLILDSEHKSGRLVYSQSQVAATFRLLHQSRGRNGEANTPGPLTSRQRRSHSSKVVEESNRCQLSGSEPTEARSLHTEWIKGFWEELGGAPSICYSVSLVKFLWMPSLTVSNTFLLSKFT